jgi:hypothetical protein
MTWLLRALAVVGGVAVSVCAAWVSRAVWDVGSVVMPWGLVLAAAGSASWVWLAGGVSPSLRMWAAGGWIVGVVVLLSRSDTVLATDALGYGFILGVTSCVCAAAVLGRGER